MTKYTKIIYSVLITLLFFSCAKESDIELQQNYTFLFKEDFNTSVDNTNFNTEGWINFNEFGTKKWTEQVFSGNGYAEFSSFGSGELVNVCWLISPPIEMDLHENEKLIFQSAHSFLTTTENTLDLYVSTNFDGTNVANANWIKIPAKTATPDTKRFTFVNSGEVDLSKYKGTLRFAFKITGSGINTNLDATFQLDNVSLYYPSN